ncbi:MAG TPA: serine hydrolase [Opitutaceae bacterium]
MKIVGVMMCLAGMSATALAAAGLPRSTPEAQGVSTQAVQGFVAAAEAKIDALHSFMLVRRGHVVAEGWWAPYTAADRHQMYSLSKSFTSTAVGLAIADGKFKLEDTVLSFFPGEAPAKPSAHLQAMRVRDLLTMSAGHHTEDLPGVTYTSTETSAVKAFLSLPVAHKPGTLFTYSTPATYMLSAIVQKTTGETVLDYLGPRLFQPLGISMPTWDASAQGISMGGTGLNVRTEDIAKFGLLYLRRGQWEGRQLVPAAWVDTATSRWVSNGSSPTSDWDQGYGFQFWRCRYGVYRGDGAHGQFCVVFPDEDAVLAITAGTRNLQGVLNVVWETLLPELQKKAPALPADAAANAALAKKLASLALKTPATVPTPKIAESVMGRTFIFAENPQRVEALTLRADAVVVTINGAQRRIPLAAGRWVRDADLNLAGSGGWTAPDTFTFEVARYTTPFTTRYTLTFTETELTMEMQQNVAQARPDKLVGKRR